MRAPAGDRLILLLTFALTVMVDLTVAISVGVVLASMLFMHRMSNAVEIQSHTSLIERDTDDFKREQQPDYTRRAQLPKGVEAFEMRGPFFFGVANRLNDVLDRIGPFPTTFILILREVPRIDATGVSALQEFLARCARQGTSVFLVEMTPPVRTMLASMGVLQSDVHLAATFDDAIAALKRNEAPVDQTP
jgi:SulP family sulfate permease